MISPFLKTPLLHLSVFRGPFDLLYQLLQKGEIPWSDLPLVEVALGFETFEEVEEKSAFLSHFVHLAYLKVGSLFPKETSLVEEESHHSISDVIASYQTAAALKDVLVEQESLSSLIYRRAPLPLSLPKKRGLEGVALKELERLFRALLEKNKFNLSLPQEEEFRLENTLDDLLISLIHPLSFENIFDISKKEEWIPLFLALLEGLKQQRILMLDNFKFQVA